MPAWLVTTNYPPVGGGVSRYNKGLVTASKSSILVAGVDGFSPAPVGEGLISRLKQAHWAWVIARRLSRDLLIIVSPPHLGIGVWLSRRKFSQIIHGGEWEDFPLGRFLLRLFLGRANSIVANSVATKNRWIPVRKQKKTLVITPGLSSVTPLASKSKTFSEARRYSARAPFQVLTVARLSVRKSHDRLIRAVDLANQNGLPVHLRIVGSGALESYLRSLAEDFSFVSIESNLRDEELVDAYDSADLFALLPREVPGREVWEGFGIVYLEAAARAVPVLASRTGGVLEALSPEGSKVLSEGSSPSEIAIAIQDLASSPATLNSMSVANLRWAAQNTWASRIEAIEGLLRRN